jgi:hypothetical protein
VVFTGPWPSIGLPRASKTRPNISSPIGTSTIAPVRVTVSPYWIYLNKLKLLPIISEDDDTNIVGLQVKGHASNPWSELDHLSCLNLVQSYDSGNTVTDTNDCTELFNIVLH